MIADVVALVSLCVAALAVGATTSRECDGLPIRPARSRHHVGFEGEPLGEGGAERLDRITIELLRMHSR